MQTEYARITDPQWEVMKQLLPVQRKRKHDLREILDAILWILRTGSQWRNLPEKFPNWNSVYYYFRVWKQKGNLERINFQLNMLYRQQVNKEKTPSAVSIDTQSVKKAPFVLEATGIDGNKKINGRKRHIVTDTLGLVWGVTVHAANQHDGPMGPQVIAPLIGYLHRMKKVFADAAYRVGLGEWLGHFRGSIELGVSSRPPSEKGFVPVKIRWVTEQTFGTFSFFRRLDKDHEKTTNSAEAWVLWQNCQRILNRIQCSQ